jgi:hypothetical protein
MIPVVSLHNYRTSLMHWTRHADPFEVLVFPTVRTLRVTSLPVNSGMISHDSFFVTYVE